MRPYPPLTPKRMRRARHFVKCVKTTQDHAFMRHRLGYWRAWRHSHRWRIRFAAEPSYEQQWAVNTGACESGNDPTKHSPNGDHGAMQFKLATAYSAGFKEDPHMTTIWEQYVRAIRWKHIAGSGQWPVCG